jgi:hypothetical protein
MKKAIRRGSLLRAAGGMAMRLSVAFGAMVLTAALCAPALAETGGLQTHMPPQPLFASS